MTRAIKLYTGSDGASHFTEGSVSTGFPTEVTTIHFEESPPHALLDWHVAPRTQYVITLSGTLEFAMRDDTTFVLHPGDVLIAADVVGTGHKWRLIDDDPWRRAYVGIKPGSPDGFVPNG